MYKRQQFIEANREIDKLVRGLKAISAGNQDAYFERLAGSANKLGIPIREVSLAFLELNAATRDTDFEGQKTQAAFEALGNALSVTGADSVRFQRGFRALTQILSKDQLFAEELRQQLGEALPTACLLYTSQATSPQRSPPITSTSRWRTAAP